MSDNQTSVQENLIKELLSDRQAAKDKEKRESWTKWTSLSIVFIAVLAAYCSQKSGSCGSKTMVNLNEATFNQSSASDQWSFYQAKSIKGGITELAIANAVQKNDQAQVDQIKAKLARYESEKKDIEAKARKFEEARDKNREQAAYFSFKGGQLGLASSLFQISIAVASVCLVMKKKGLWYISLVIALGAVAQMIYGLLL